MRTSPEYNFDHAHGGSRLTQTDLNDIARLRFSDHRQLLKQLSHVCASDLNFHNKLVDNFGGNGDRTQLAGLVNLWYELVAFLTQTTQIPFAKNLDCSLKLLTAFEGRFANLGILLFGNLVSTSTDWK
ncbi:hypothetical protein TNIN_268101 [Trichonephila inaurata madagascariensis]|uniref:Uncharacterized protein n=1 Tax=Trichonephila inaurata madagascariensis TaxID=2747483 RepID=A0A8X6XQI4_9ARAC|nr:hypothetical protein TNIN_268101 [Trichonephila inaurata madagascariensis]